MGTVVTTDVTNGQVIDPSVFNNNFTAVKNQVNGNIDNSNIKAGAAIDPAKLSQGTDGQVLTTSAGVVGWATPATGGGSGTIPIGVGSDFWGATAPSGWLFADGAAISRITYATLFGVIGTTYGSGDGSTTFNLPDMRGRSAVMKGTHTDVDALGDNDGSVIGSRTPKHKHTVPNHTHTYSHTIGTVGSGIGQGIDAMQSSETTFTTGSSAVAVGPQTNSPTDGPAYLVCNYIIYTGV